MKRISNIILLISLLFFTAECKKKAGDRIIAKVGNEKLCEHEFRSLFTEQEWLNTTDEDKNEIINEWIEITLLAKEAEKRGLDKEKDVKFNIKYCKRTILANEILADELSKIQVTEDELFNYYNLNRTLFTREVTSFKIQKFIVSNWAIADSAIKLFNSGEAFYTVAKNLGSGYVVKFVGKDDISNHLWNFLCGMKKWNIRIVQDKGKLNIIQLLNIKRENVPIPYNSIKDSLTKVILDNKKNTFLENALDSLKINYTVKIY
ncbi:MAG: hypothetical protein H8D22_01245 [Candidatus Cloacimonetes bacterium]|nr:hypothetical protein [Candidatus Cloacimonadota bacterium]